MLLLPISDFSIHLFAALCSCISIYIYLLFVYIYYTDSLSICVVEPSSQVFCWRIGYDVTFLKQGSMANGSWNAALRQMDRILAKLV